MDAVSCFNHIHLSVMYFLVKIVACSCSVEFPLMIFMSVFFNSLVQAHREQIEHKDAELVRRDAIILNNSRDK